MKTIKILLIILFTVLLLSCQKDELFNVDNNQVELHLNKTYVNDDNDTIIFSRNSFKIYHDYGTYIEWNYFENDSTPNIITKSIISEYNNWTYENTYLIGYNNDIRYVFELVIFEHYIILDNKMYY